MRAWHLSYFPVRKNILWKDQDTKGKRQFTRNPNMIIYFTLTSQPEKPEKPEKKLLSVCDRRSWGKQHMTRGRKPLTTASSLFSLPETTTVFIWRKFFRVLGSHLFSLLVFTRFLEPLGFFCKKHTKLLQGFLYFTWKNLLSSVPQKWHFHLKSSITLHLMLNHQINETWLVN